MLEHCHSYPVFVICRRCHEEPMKQFVDDTFHGRAYSQMTAFRETQTTAGAHGLLANIRIPVIQKVQHRVLDKVDSAHGKGLEVEHLECPESQSDHLSPLCGPLVRIFACLVILLKHAALFDEPVEEVLILLVKHQIVELLELSLWLVAVSLCLLAQFCCHLRFAGAVTSSVNHGNLCIARIDKHLLLRFNGPHTTTTSSKIVAHVLQSGHLARHGAKPGQLAASRGLTTGLALQLAIRAVGTWVCTEFCLSG